MIGSFVPQVGAVFSADIAVPDHARALRFYARVLGTGTHPLWRDDLMNNLGLPIIGLGARDADTAHLPLQWMPHIQVQDVASSTRRAVELGGSELMHSRDPDGASQWAVLLDPTGAAFGIIPVLPSEAVPSEAVSPPDGSDGDGGGAGMGRIAWLDLTVAHAPGARDFYREVVGWTVHEVSMDDGEGAYADYAMLAGNGDPVAGVCHARGVNLGLPPVWLLYLPVGDLAESLRRVGAEGGEVVRQRTGEDDGHPYAVIRDPVGAFVALTPAVPLHS